MSPHLPERTCVGCRQKKPKAELLRVARSLAGTIDIDPEARTAGRGAYVCYSVECVKKARKSRGLDRTLKHAVPEMIYTALEKFIQSKRDERER